MAHTSGDDTLIIGLTLLEASLMRALMMVESIMCVFRDFFSSFSSFVVPRIAITSVFLADTHYFISSGSAAWAVNFYSKMVSYVYRFLPARLQMNGIIAERDGPIQRRKDVAIAGSRTACC